VALAAAGARGSSPAASPFDAPRRAEFLRSSTTTKASTVLPLMSKTTRSSVRDDAALGPALWRSPGLGWWIVTVVFFVGHDLDHGLVFRRVETPTLPMSSPLPHAGQLELVSLHASVPRGGPEERRQERGRGGALLRCRGKPVRFSRATCRAQASSGGTLSRADLRRI
jgi:hypothetical protein